MIELTNYCSFSCKFCIHEHMKRPRGFMEFELFRRVVDDVQCHGLAVQLNFSGIGEPMLHPRFFDFVDYAAQAGLRINVITNCFHLSPEVNERLVKSGITQMLLSAQTPTAETYAIRRASNGSFEEYIENIKDLVGRRLHSSTGPELTVSYISTMHNAVLDACEELADQRVVGSTSEMHRLVADWSAFARQIAPETASCYSRLEVLSRFVTSNQSVFKVAPSFAIMFVDMHFWWHDAMIPANLAIVPQEYGLCPLPGTFVVWWDGRTHFCCHDVDASSGDLNTQTVSEIWTSPLQLTLLKSLKQGELVEAVCRRCRGKVVDLRTGKLLGSGLPLWIRASRSIAGGHAGETFRKLLRSKT